mgnify:CR=1 FL=1
MSVYERSVHVDASFQSIHDLFAPFFFVGIGLKVDPSLLTTALGPAVSLLGVALLGKLLGTGGPAWAKLGFGSGVVLGVTMWPRAEIALIVMERGNVEEVQARNAPVVVCSMCRSGGAEGKVARLGTAGRRAGRRSGRAVDRAPG